VIIACPSCEARFNLDPAKLLPAGRNVRCAKCGHRWRQMPEGYAAREAVPETPAEPDSTPPATAAEAAAPEEAETHPPSPPTTPAEMAQSLAQIAEQVTGQAAKPEAEAAESNPIARLTRRAASSGPITMPPRMKPMRPAKRNSNLGLVLAAGLVVGLLIAGWVFRDVIARTVPGADVIYSLLGLSTDNPGSDLEISIDNAKINTNEQTGKKVFDLTATIFNLSTYPMPMPPLMVVPVDDAGSAMEPLAFRLAERVIEPGQNIKFRKSFEDWPSGAPNFELRLAQAE